MRRTLILAALAGLAVATAARAGSIWARAEGRSGTRPVAVFADDTARAVGDVVTIVINEHSVINNDTTRANDKDANRNATTNGTVNVQDIAHWWSKQGHDFTLPTIGATSTAGHDFTGTAGYETDREITDQVTVVVQDVMPNGNLVVTGSRTRLVNGDAQVIRVSGIVRPSDLTFANTVRSDQVADFRMTVEVDGPETHWTNPGWLGRLLNWLSPW